MKVHVRSQFDFAVVMYMYMYLIVVCKNWAKRK